MKGKLKNFFTSLLTQDMAKQARQVEIITVLVFIALLVVIGLLWQYQIELTGPAPKMNIFELLLSKK